MKKRCKHKNQEIRNEIVGGYNIPEGCTTEYDIYCRDCGEHLAHWAFGSFDDPDDIIKYQLEGMDKIKAWIKYHILYKIESYFINRKVSRLCKRNGDNLPF